jgi:hypothetical protein
MARLASFLLLCTLNASCDFDTFSEPSDEHNVRVAQSIIDPIGPHANASDFRDVKGLGHWHLDAVLQTYVGDDGGRYDALAKDAEALQLLDDYGLILAGARPESMSQPAERIAFWLNAYTAIVLKSLVALVQKNGVDAVVSHDEFAIFTKHRHQIAGFEITLEELEHLVLRGHAEYPDVKDTPGSIARVLLEHHRLLFPSGRFDPRVNFALSFGARGFPPMPTKAYRSSTLETLLENRTRAFINDRAYGVNELGISVLFQWFRRDFADNSGSVSTFILAYLDDTNAAFNIHRNLQFDWRVR